jgi:hypothetical protein
MMRTLLVVMALALPLTQAKGQWQAAEPLAYDFIGAGHVYAHFQGYEADPGEPLARIVSFDANGGISEVQVIWYVGMDSTGLSLARQTWSPGQAVGAAFRDKFASLQPQIDARSLALDAVLGRPQPGPRQELRLPPPTVVYRTEVAGLLLAGVGAGFDDPRGHVRLQISILHDTTVVAQLLAGF